MNRRVLGLVAAFVLAALGTIAIVAYVSGAEDRAMAGERIVEVLVVKDDVPAGTPAEDLGDRVVLEEVAEKVRAEGAVTTVTTLEGKVAGANLVPGEQLVEQRFIEPTAFRASGAAVDVPAGLLSTTISVEPDRAVGGVLTPGSLVGVTASFTGGEGAEGKGQSHMTLRKVLVTNVQTDAEISEDDENDESSSDSVEPGDAPTSAFLVTLALDAPSAERLIFAAEHGTIWLSLEPSDAPDGGTKIVTQENVYQ
ncbi:MAG: Flp pilus assembly protein CpaB [Acidimicrobiia bacterium]